MDRTARTWWTGERAGATLTGVPTGVKSLDLLTDWVRGTPEKLREALLQGDRAYALVGPEEIDGHEVLHLRSTRKGGAEDLWVDAETYRPVRLVMVKPGDGMNIRRQEDIRWLPRDSQSLALFTVAVPAGFARLDPSVVATPLPGGPHG